ncbi:NAD-dependent deacylase [Leucobacter sp. W1478]|uniref:NAD-dependent deacylase n=1 Tax=Leucobacter sp. W1478 TaxID=3439065 RepID=UPI003F2D1204
MKTESDGFKDLVLRYLPYLAAEFTDADRPDLAQRVREYRGAHQVARRIPGSDFDRIVSIGMQLGLETAFAIAKTRRAIRLVVDTPGLDLSTETVSEIVSLIDDYQTLNRYERTFNESAAYDSREAFEYSTRYFAARIGLKLEVSDVLDHFRDITESEYQQYLREHAKLLQSDSFIGLDSRIFELPYELRDEFDYGTCEDIENEFEKQHGTHPNAITAEQQELLGKWQETFKAAAREFLLKAYAGEIGQDQPLQSEAEAPRRSASKVMTTNQEATEENAPARSKTEAASQHEPTETTRHPKIVVLTGAGISAESGISTFRDVNGLWENHRIEEVASPGGFAKNPDLVHRFYDARRAQLHEVRPNAAHWALARLEAVFPGDVLIITQNVDDLHEAAMSENVLHMHGRLISALCTACGTQQDHVGDLGHRPACRACGERSLRPDIVWFGEQVRDEELIRHAVENCEIFAVIGTSGVVYPAAGLVKIAEAHGAQTVLIDLDPDAHDDVYDLVYKGPASENVPHWVREVMLRYGDLGGGEYDGQDLSGELEHAIEEFVNGERDQAAHDWGNYAPRDAQALLDRLLIKTPGGHPAMGELDVVVRELTAANSNTEAGGVTLFKFALAHAARTAPARAELRRALISYATDLIAWIVVDSTSTARIA